MHACLSDADATALIDGELGERARDDVLAHLDACPVCRDLVADAARASGPRAVAGAVLARGAEVGRHVVLDLVGAGATGTVYAAWDPKLDRKIALKRLHVHGAGVAALRARLAREARAMARLSHPHVVTVHDVAEHAGELYLEMEFVEGGTLASFLRERRRDVRDVVRVLAQAGEGLAAAHAAGLVHRDFKPENVLVAADGRVKVSDLGLARAPELVGEGVAGASHGPDASASGSAGLLAAEKESSARDAQLTATGALVGTPAYMAPEQLAGEPATAASDQFAFGVTLYEALHGQRPFAGSDLATLRAAVERGLPPRDARVPAWLDRVLRRALAARPSDRFPDMRSLLTALAHGPGRRARRAWFALAAIGMFAAAGVGFALTRTSSAPAACAGSELAFGDVWSDATAEAVTQALTRALPEGADTRTRAVMNAFASFRARWIAAHGDACAATRVRGEQSEARLDQRMRCLHNARAQARALAALLVEADARSAAEAQVLAQRLPDPEACQRTPDVKPPPEPPTPASDDERATGDDLDDAIARGKAFVYAGRHADAKHVLEPLLARADAAGDGAARARLSLALGEALFYWGDREGGFRHIADGIAAAITIGDDATAADACTLYANLVGYGNMRPAEAQPWLELAAASIARLGGDAERSARLAIVEGSIRLFSEWRIEEAKALVVPARATLAHLHGEDYYLVVAADDVLGGVALRENRAGEALELFRRSERTRVALFSSEHPVVVKARLNQAEALAALGRAGEAEALVRALLASDEQRAEAWIALASLLRARAEPEQALDADEHALALVPGHSYALEGAARDELALGKPRAAIRPLEVALAQRPSPLGHAKVEAALARALWDAGGDRARALNLAHHARYMLAPLATRYGGEWERETQALETWLATRQVP